MNEEWCELFGRLGIEIGVSLDGTEEDNNKNRIDHAGKGSYSRIINGLKIAQNSKFLKNNPGILSVINIEADPLIIYKHFKDLGVKAVDFLLPEANYITLPFQKADFYNVLYGEWLIKMFDAWFYDKDPNRILKIRFFDQIIHMILGGVVSSDLLGELENQVLVIETDGGVEAVDALKICGNGFTKAGINVSTHTFDEALETSLAKLYYLSHSNLCEQCNTCLVKEICGGGCLPHRYSKSRGFNNPSVYCHDLLKLITHIQNCVLQTMPNEVLKKINIGPIGYNEALEMLIPNKSLACEQEGVYEQTNF